MGATIRQCHYTGPVVVSGEPSYARGCVQWPRRHVNDDDMQDVLFQYYDDENKLIETLIFLNYEIIVFLFMHFRH